MDGAGEPGPIPKAASGKGTITCKTYKGGTLIGTKSVTFTATVPGSMKPEVAAGWPVSTGTTAAPRPKPSTHGYRDTPRPGPPSTRRSITCKQGASIQSCAISYQGSRTEKEPVPDGGHQRHRRHGALYGDGQRACPPGRTSPCAGGSTQPRRWWRRTCSGRMRTPGNRDSGTHIGGIAKAKVSDLGGKNTYTLKGCWKAVGGSYGSGTEMQSGTATLVTGETEISVDKSYTAKIVLTDKLGNTASYEGSSPRSG